jgi:hypothetical protein
MTWGIVLAIYARTYPGMPVWRALLVAARWVGVLVLCVLITVILVIYFDVPAFAAYFFALAVLIPTGIVSGILPARVLK